MSTKSMPLVSESRPPPRFLTAHWKDLVMLNYEVNPDMLMPWLPPGLELDFWQGKTLVSVVGFRFEDTRVLGVAIPGHRDFQEVNLRFYARRRVADGWRRGWCSSRSSRLAGPLPASLVGHTANVIRPCRWTACYGSARAMENRIGRGP